ncbi:MAG: hypothetical protein PVJ57_06935 [Phycisphaerae bacterium]|jgi:hypothetical protein
MSASDADDKLDRERASEVRHRYDWLAMLLLGLLLLAGGAVMAAIYTGLMAGVGWVHMAGGLVWIWMCSRVFRKARLRRERAWQGHCVNCGYNLTGNTSGVCPECGTAVQRAERE